MAPEHKIEEYHGFEQGPIRPPSEAYSLLIRVTRNCPWNRCTFCPVYKDSRFSIRPVAHVKRDIDSVYRYVQTFKDAEYESGRIGRVEAKNRFEKIGSEDPGAYQAALHWYGSGMKSVFIQDANSLILKPSDLVEVLSHLKNRFPWVDRITSYARSHTIARISEEDLRAISQAGLNRIHIGLESGSDAVLKLIQKGVDRETHVRAGVKVKKAGMELSEYVMPGLGGRELSKTHALETADALNRIDPDFIRLRTLAIPNGLPLFEQYRDGIFQKCTDRMVVEEIVLLIENLKGVSGKVRSDHILNLFQEVEGKLPEDRERMLAPLREFLQMDPERQSLYQVGRRLGIFSRLSDMESPHRMARVQKTCSELGIGPENVDAVVDELMKRFI